MTATAETPVTVLSTVAAKMPTRSGDVRLMVVTDAEAPKAMPGDLLLVMTSQGYQPFTVHRVRTGIAFDSSVPPVQYEVPVIEGSVPGGKILARDPSDLLRTIAHNLPPRIVVQAPEPVMRTDVLLIQGNDGVWSRVRIRGPWRPDEPVGMVPGPRHAA